MTKLEKLIEELCPNGVEYRKLGLLCIIRTGRLNANAMVEDGDYPFFTCDATPYRIDNYAFDTDAILISGNGSQIGHLHKYNGKFNAYQRTYVLDKFDVCITKDFLYFYLGAYIKPHILKYCKKGSVPYITLPMLKDFCVPVPPIDVQNEIVRILDNFTELTAKLMAEHDLRKKQYEEISYQCLVEHNSGEKYSIEKLCDLSKGCTPIQKAVPGDYPLVVTTSERKSSETFQYDDCAVCIPLVSSRGHGVASLNHVYYQEGKFALGNILCAMIPKDNRLVSAKYLYYYFECTKNYTLVPLMKGGANMSMHISDIQRVKVPVPVYEEQSKIISILEKLEEYCFKILPAEIEARQKQYEYYRDKLLTFKEKHED